MPIYDNSKIDFNKPTQVLLDDGGFIACTVSWYDCVKTPGGKVRIYNGDTFNVDSVELRNTSLRSDAEIDDSLDREIKRLHADALIEKVLNKSLRDGKLRDQHGVLVSKKPKRYKDFK
jgi:hypothetical protein